MGAKHKPLPTYREDMFNFEGREEWLETLIPLHHNRLPRGRNSIDPRLWAVRGLLAPGRPNRILVANIADVEIDNPASPNGKRTIIGAEIAEIFTAARRDRLLEEYDSLSFNEANSSSLVLPYTSLQKSYLEGIAVAPEETFAQRPVVEPAGRIATVGSRLIAPTPAFNPS